MPNKRFETIVIMLIFISGFLLYIFGNSEKKLLNREGVYVIGKLLSSRFVGEVGWRYEYQYKFNGKLFFKSFTGPLAKQMRNDSLMFFKILPAKPSVCRQLTDVSVPKCLQLDIMPPNGWDTLPLKACN